MIEQDKGKNRIAQAVLVGALLLLAGYAGGRYLHQPAKIVFADASADARGEAVVRVSGRVKKPGEYRFRLPAKVREAIARAGGVQAGGDIVGLDLESSLADGMEVYVPAKDSKVAEPAGTKTPHGRFKAKVLPSPASVSINTAGSNGLEKLPGVGPATARRILEYRRSHGRFRSVDELLAVKGIGPKKLAKMRRYVRL